MNFSKMAERAIWPKETEETHMSEYYLAAYPQKRVEKALRRAYAEGYKKARSDMELVLTAPPGTWESSYLNILKAKVVKFKPFGSEAKGVKRDD